MSNKKLLRAEETVKREIGYILDRKVQDPRIGMATVTRVELSDDFRYARVHVSFMGDAREREEALGHLRKAVKFVRGELAHSLRMRVSPFLTFVLDESSERYIRISEVLKRIEDEDDDGQCGSDDTEVGSDDTEVGSDDTEAGSGEDDGERPQ
jgi:ribosome-binding factor A